MNPYDDNPRRSRSSRPDWEVDDSGPRGHEADYGSEYPEAADRPAPTGRASVGRATVGRASVPGSGPAAAPSSYAPPSAPSRESSYGDPRRGDGPSYGVDSYG